MSYNMASMRMQRASAAPSRVAGPCRRIAICPASVQPVERPSTLLAERYVSPLERERLPNVFPKGDSKFSSMANLTPEHFSQYMQDVGDDVVLVDFYTDLCGPCKLMRAELEKLAGVFPNIRFAKFDMGNFDGPFLQRLAVRGLPTFRIYRGGRPIDEISGARPTQLRQMLVHHNRPPSMRVV